MSVVLAEAKAAASWAGERKSTRWLHMITIWLRRVSYRQRINMAVKVWARVWRAVPLWRRVRKATHRSLKLDREIWAEFLDMRLYRLRWSERASQTSMRGRNVKIRFGTLVTPNDIGPTFSVFCNLRTSQRTVFQLGSGGRCEGIIRMYEAAWSWFRNSIVEEREVEQQSWKCSMSIR